MLFWPLNPMYTQIPNSPTSIIWGQTNFPSSLTTISGFLSRCFFDLSTRFVLKFRLPDLDYPKFDRSYEVSQTRVHNPCFTSSRYNVKSDNIFCRYCKIPYEVCSLVVLLSFSGVLKRSSSWFFGNTYDGCSRFSGVVEIVWCRFCWNMKNKLC